MPLKVTAQGVKQVRRSCVAFSCVNWTDHHSISLNATQSHVRSGGRSALELLELVLLEVAEAEAVSLEPVLDSSSPTAASRSAAPSSSGIAARRRRFAALGPAASRPTLLAAVRWCLPPRPLPRPLPRPRGSKGSPCSAACTCSRDHESMWSFRDV